MFGLKQGIENCGLDCGYEVVGNEAILRRCFERGFFWKFRNFRVLSNFFSLKKIDH